MCVAILSLFFRNPTLTTQQASPQPDSPHARVQKYYLPFFTPLKACAVIVHTRLCTHTWGGNVPLMARTPHPRPPNERQGSTSAVFTTNTVRKFDSPPSWSYCVRETKFLKKEILKEPEIIFYIVMMMRCRIIRSNPKHSR